MTLGAFDRATELRPTGQIFPEERLAWMPLHDA